MIKRFRAWDGKQYWYADENLLFVEGSKALGLRAAPFELKDVEMFINKIDLNGIMIYENDILESTISNVKKLYQVIWSTEDCGFRKVPYGMPYPETKIDEAFIRVIGTIHSQGD